MALSTYGHVIEELEGAKKLPAETVIRQARDKLVRTTFARRTKRSGGGPEKSLENAESPLTDSNRRPPPYHRGFVFSGGFEEAGFPPCFPWIYEPSGLLSTSSSSCPGRP
jgi:hypothetical protein